MFIEFYTKNLNEYNKIIDVLYSCKNVSHIECANNMIDAFAQNIEFRIMMLTKFKNQHPFNFEYRRKLKSFCMASTDQMDNICAVVQAWMDGYNLAVQEENQPKPRINIEGFRKIIKKKYV